MTDKGYVDANGVHTYYEVRGRRASPDYRADARHAWRRRCPDRRARGDHGSHGLMFEKPDLVTRLILDFLADEQPPKFMS